MADDKSSTSTSSLWWKSACIYQIYPASFKSANGGAFGDLPGILEKIPYIQSIGADAIWISPFFKSPNYDYGYDIADYKVPDPRYGTLDDVTAIIDECHKRGMKILFDLVVNHTSHLHPWFVESRKSKDNPYRKYYHWHPGHLDADGNRRPPTNWKGAFGGSVWELDELTDEYYFHSFLKEQPDLQWEVPEVRQHIYEEALIYWFERGVDGFRVDTSALYSKHDFVDVEVTDKYNFYQESSSKAEFGPNLDAYLQEMRRETFDKYNGFTLAEMGGKDTSLPTMLRYVAQKEKKYDTAIRFDLVHFDHGGGDGRYTLWAKNPGLVEFKKIAAEEQELANPKHAAWLAMYLESHDQARSISRFADDSSEHRVTSAKMLAIYLGCMSGTLLMYQGQEIGMVNMPADWSLDEYDDPATKMFWEQLTQDLKNGLNDGIHSEEGGKKSLAKIARDHARVPFQWDQSQKQAGFSTADKTWMRVIDNGIDVASQEKDSDSPLNLWRKLLKLRKNEPDLFTFGHFTLLDKDNEHTMTYTKTSYSTSEKSLLVALNFTGSEQSVHIPKHLEKQQRELLASAVSHPNEDTLAPWEGRVYSYSA